MSKSITDYIKLSIPNKPEYVSVVRLTVAAIANRMGFNVEDIEDIKIAIAEACTNAITHGKKEDKNNFDIEFIVKDDKLTMVVCDSGRGCITDEISVPNLNDPKEGGLGIFIIKSLMDEVEITSNLGKGTIIRMSKNRGDDN
ncbi:histidine kinase [Alkaliphilus pronyensis]|uniref:Histidine kinase n=1 Tax=Alkaliphilus pronyensis TaxID=1482732 RepID=A0A6I0FEC4_9FIRM|nr:ATP-binding protein [Alkaliphilus pronyensis]KAB3533821.1 histidine kinase [Alkaliphilus pronyensis]